MVRPHGPLIHASGSSAYEIFCSLFSDELLALLVEETNRYYDQTVAALGGPDNLPSLIQFECGECKEGSVHLTLTTIFCRCQQTVQLPPVPKTIELKQTTSPKTVKKCFIGNYITTMYFVLCIVFFVLYIVCCISQYCVVPTIKCKFFQQNLLFFHKNKNLFCVNY